MEKKVNKGGRKKENPLDEPAVRRSPTKKVNGKKKGSDYELVVAKLLGAWWGESFQRTPASGGLRWHKDNRVMGDIVTPPDSKFPFVVECKKREGWVLDQWMTGAGEMEKWWIQVTADADRSGTLKPMLIFSKNFAKNYVMMYEEDFTPVVSGVVTPHMTLHTKGIKPRIIVLLDDLMEKHSKESILQHFDT